MKKKKEPENVSENDNQTETKMPTLEEKITALENEVAEWKNKHALAYADMANLRKAQEKSFLEALRYRAEGFVDKLVPALDAFHIAIKNPVDDPKLKNYLTGFEYIYNQLQQALESEGFQLIPIKVGDTFNVQTMNALDTEVNEGPADVVLKVLSPGYKLYDRIVKPAMVIVSKKADVKAEEVDDKTKETGSQAA